MSDTPESHREDVSNLGQNARQVLDNPAFVRAFTDMREQIMAAIEKADMRDTEGMVLLLQQAKLLGRVRDALQSMVAAAEYADKERENAYRENLRTAETPDEESRWARGIAPLRRLAGR